VTVESRFFSKVGWSVGRFGGAPCLEWMANKDRRGYGRFWNGAKKVLAHRWLYEHWMGPIPAGLELDHLCRNPSCVNPKHLEPVTHQENCRRGDAGKMSGLQQQAKMHCPHGHPYSGDNLAYDKNGHRYCRTCVNARSLAGYHERKARAT